jgi:hypothetical protein
MPVVDRVASGVGTALTPIVLDHREVLRVDEPPARLAGPPDPRDRGTVTGDLTALLWGGAVRIFLMHTPSRPPPGTGPMVARSTYLHSSSS